MSNANELDEAMGQHGAAAATSPHARPELADEIRSAKSTASASQDTKRRKDEDRSESPPSVPSVVVASTKDIPIPSSPVNASPWYESGRQAVAASAFPSHTSSATSHDARPTTLLIPTPSPPTATSPTSSTTQSYSTPATKSKSEAGEGDDAPSWPFTNSALSAHRLFAAQSPQHADTPTDIHSSYSDIPGFSKQQQQLPSRRDSSLTSGDDDVVLTFGSSPASTRPSSPSSRSEQPLVSKALLSVSSAVSASALSTPPRRNGTSSSSSGATTTTTTNGPASEKGADYRRLSPSGQRSTRGSSPLHSSTAESSSLSLPTSRLMNSTLSLLVLYFCFNLGLTLFNKLVLQGFPFPWTLTGIQMLSGTIGTQIAWRLRFFEKANLSTREGLVMLAFSVLYTINIAVSNLSLHLVTVPFHQVVRAMTPLFTILLSIVFLHRRYSRATYLALVPVITGVVLATYGDYYFTLWGLILTLIGTVLAALKTIVTNRIQVGRLKLHPLDLLVRMSPLALVQCIFFSWYSGEMQRVGVYAATEMTRRKMLALAMNGLIAFGLNVVSFTANKKTSPLTMTVAANVKQVLTIILAVFIFHLQLNPMNLMGIILTLSGGAWYAKVELQEKSRGVHSPPSSLPFLSTSKEGQQQQQPLMPSSSPSNARWEKKSDDS